MGALHEDQYTFFSLLSLNPLTLNDLERRRAVSLLKIKIPSKKSRQAALHGVI
jgi:hypothetical protein